MAAVGIIAEYNPFHKGHRYHLEQAKSRSGCEHAIVVMSGNFVQRGEPAAFDKRLRAECALNNGADLVLELPTAFALSSAEGFARGGVKVLSGTGLLSHLAFGAESDDLAALRKSADFLEDEAFKACLREKLSEGKSFPRARQEALMDSGISSEEAELCASPNNILALEYLRALSLYGDDILPLPIKREGAAHDAEGIGMEFPSASAIRAALTAGDTQAAFSALPEETAKLLSGVSPVSTEDISSLILYTLRWMDTEQLAKLPDVTEGLENLIYRECRTTNCYEELLTRLKSKRYTLARLRRIMMCALLGIESDTAKNGLDHAYIRVLGIRKDAMSLLSELGKYATLPVIIRGEDLKKLPEGARELLKFDTLSGEIYSLAKKEAACKNEFAQPLLIV